MLVFAWSRATADGDGIEGMVQDIGQDRFLLNAEFPGPVQPANKTRRRILAARSVRNVALDLERKLMFHYETLSTHLRQRSPAYVDRRVPARCHRARADGRGSRTRRDRPSPPGGT